MSTRTLDVAPRSVVREMSEGSQTENPPPRPPSPPRRPPSGRRLRDSRPSTVTRQERLALLARRLILRRAQSQTANVDRPPHLPSPLRRPRSGRRLGDSLPSTPTATHRRTRARRGVAEDVNENQNHHFDRPSARNATSFNQQQPHTNPQYGQTHLGNHMHQASQTDCHRCFPPEQYRIQPSLPLASAHHLSTIHNPQPYFDFYTQPPAQGATLPLQHVDEYEVMNRLSVSQHQAVEYNTPIQYPAQQAHVPSSQACYPPQAYHPPPVLQPVVFNRQVPTGNLPSHGQNNAQQVYQAGYQPGAGPSTQAYYPPQAYHPPPPPHPTVFNRQVHTGNLPSYGQNSAQQGYQTAYQPVAVQAIQQPSSSHAIQQPSSAHVMQQPTASHAMQQPSSSYAIQQPSSSYAMQRPSPSHAMQQPSSSYAIQQPSSSHAMGRPSPSHPIQQHSPSHAIQQPRSSQADCPMVETGPVPPVQAPPAYDEPQYLPQLSTSAPGPDPPMVPQPGTSNRASEQPSQEPASSHNPRMEVQLVLNFAPPQSRGL
ncbi:hypothetical protein PCANC_13201 [Puccinia coronata f. sp. avenae]|uniref:Uncharacterized protein n=1 Tax=Puccinia coronata f. sp. avenae TaxID=200324 RepID=A0A2N5V0B3_9BASI|nr:hypothetical protein PCANC_13201 [Puccinia coronata f. sp. avenae]